MSGKFSKIILNGETLMDVTQDTVASNNLLSGETAHGADGEAVTGSYSVDLQAKTGINPTMSSQTITADSTTVIANTGDFSQSGAPTYNNPSTTGYYSFPMDLSAIETGKTYHVTGSGRYMPYNGQIATNYTIDDDWVAGNDDIPLSISTSSVHLTWTSSGLKFTMPTSHMSADRNIEFSGNISFAVSTGYIGLSSVQINAMPSGTAGTPTATKGTVSNHSVSVTPSVTNTTGYITGGTVNGTAVSVSASELVSGTKSITENGTGIDVTDYASVDVDVPSETPTSLEIVSDRYTHVYHGTPVVNCSVAGSTYTIYPALTIGKLYKVFIECIRDDMTMSYIKSGWIDYIASSTTTNTDYSVGIRASGVSSTSSSIISNVWIFDPEETISYSPVVVRQMDPIYPTPRATKGTVSNHSVAVTPSLNVTTGGYVAASTYTGTAVNVTASELVSGTKSITENGTGIDVTNYASVDVNVSGGGEGNVIFVDYDGTVLHTYTYDQAQALSALPANPSHAGLTAQGWNWTLAQIKEQLVATPEQTITVGQMYVTSSGKTEIEIEIEDNLLDVYLSIAVHGTVNIDWGDNTTPDTVTDDVEYDETGVYTITFDIHHSYANQGNYTILINVVNGGFAFFGGGSLLRYTLLRKKNNPNSTNDDYVNYPYNDCIKNVRIGNGVEYIFNASFYHCHFLESVTIPNTIALVGETAFSNCYSIKCITIPNGITSIGSYFANSCNSLTNISIPSSITSFGVYAVAYCPNLVSILIPSAVTSIGINAFSECSSLTGTLVVPNGITSIGNYVFSGCERISKIELPNGITSIGMYAFNNCQSLEEIVIPNTVTSIGSGAFVDCYALPEISLPSTITNISASAFSYCRLIKEFTIPSGITTINNSILKNCESLQSVTIPNGVTSIGTYAFQNCYGMQEYHFKSETPPTITNTNVFSGISSTDDCTIYVPYSADHSILNTYKTASYWSSYARYMQEEPAP